MGIRKQADEIIAVLEEAIRAYVESGGDEGALPILRTSVLENGAVLMEWGSPDNSARLGFNLELEPKESGWYLVTSPATDGMAMDGPLVGGIIRPLILNVLNMLISAT